MFYCLFDLLLCQNIWKNFTKRTLKLKVQSFLNLDAAAGELTVPCKCKLTVSTRTSILEAIENRVSRFEARVSRRSKNFSRISMVDFEETINFSSLKQ